MIVVSKLFIMRDSSYYAPSKPILQYFNLVNSTY